MSTTQNDDSTESPDLIHRIASLTRMLRDSMRELGLDQAIKDAANAIPDARDRLRYVAQMTEQAANRVLNATEAAGPIQDGMSRSAQALDGRWQQWYDQPLELPEARELVKDTRAFLQDVPKQTQQTQSKLMEIIMAQDFQDLTGGHHAHDGRGRRDRARAVAGAAGQRAAGTPRRGQQPAQRPAGQPAGARPTWSPARTVDDLLASLGF